MSSPHEEQACEVGRAHWSPAAWLESDMKHVAVVPQSILRKWDRIALLQLAEAATRMHEELDEANRRYASAQADADDTWDQLTAMQLQLCEQHGMEPGITKSGHLVMVKPSTGAADQAG